MAAASPLRAVGMGASSVQSPVSGWKRSTTARAEWSPERRAPDKGRRQLRGRPAPKTSAPLGAKWRATRDRNTQQRRAGSGHSN
eukprot:CAMPEP_0175587186 /NCGR_PEP_ID=MMETSP0096-20121207/50628_1 /TAXON_ID=311494 /ORGANISM="Alexandrium monilatum, Strain CCMP3105" /LENGTH=83 /DNA_ID=CAMNT_0016891093 /DNA_START=332 /DNA_END=580 /DNA_ORIENTATION=+